jgi:hypothetical protein
VVLRHCTLAVENAFLFRMGRIQRFDLRTASSLFVAKKLCLVMSPNPRRRRNNTPDGEDLRTLFGSLVSWSESSNVYAPEMEYLCGWHGTTPISGEIGGLAAWRELYKLPETGSVEAKLQFRPRDPTSASPLRLDDSPTIPLPNGVGADPDHIGPTAS